MTLRGLSGEGDYGGLVKKGGLGNFMEEEILEVAFEGEVDLIGGEASR